MLLTLRMLFRFPEQRTQNSRASALTRPINQGHGSLVELEAWKLSEQRMYGSQRSALEGA